MSMPREVLRHALHLCARNWRVLWPMAALLLLPLILVQAASVGLIDLVVPGARDSGLGLAGKTVILFADVVVHSLTLAVVILAVSRRVEGHPIAVGATWREGLGRIRPVLTSALASLLPTMGWALLLLLPFGIVGALFGESVRGLAISLGIAVAVGFLAVRLAFVACVAMLEGLGGFPAYRRNLALAEGHFWSLASVLSTLAVLEYVLAALAGHLLPESAAIPIRSAVGGVLLPFEAVLVTLFYRRLRTAVV